MIMELLPYTEADAILETQTHTHSDTHTDISASQMQTFCYYSGSIFWLLSSFNYSLLLNREDCKKKLHKYTDTQLCTDLWIVISQRNLVR